MENTTNIVAQEKDNVYNTVDSGERYNDATVDSVNDKVQPVDVWDEFEANRKAWDKSTKENLASLDPVPQNSSLTTRIEKLHEKEEIRTSSYLNVLNEFFDRKKNILCP